MARNASQPAALVEEVQVEETPVEVVAEETVVASAEEIPVDAVAEIAPEEEIQPEPIESSPWRPEERPVFLEQWVATEKSHEPEVLGTFAFYAQQKGLVLLTPSLWYLELTRWLHDI